MGALCEDAPSLRRAPSVDDLFAPLWRLEVQHQQQQPQQESLQINSNEAISAAKCDQNTRISDRFSTCYSVESVTTTSASDEDHPATTTVAGLDDKKQKRMLSNRESARRSRLRKQQHLDDLRSQLLELRTHNSSILSKLNAATQQFTQLNRDNQLLRMHALELSTQLQKLHQRATAFHPEGLHAFGFGNSHLDPPGLSMQEPSAYALVSGALSNSSSGGL